MKTIEEAIQDEIIIKNSRFICIMMPIEIKNISETLEKVKKMHPKATHVCYGYIYDEINHSSDDGEPSGTAGQPILNVLEKEELNHILCIVIRYFGGIKLGAGGLVRAYTKSVTEVLKNAKFQELIKGYRINIEFPYEEEKNVLYQIGKYPILEKEYLEKIKYICQVDEKTLDKLKDYSIKIEQSLYIPKAE